MKKERYLHVRIDEDTWEILQKSAAKIQNRDPPNVSVYLRSLIRTAGCGMTDELAEAIRALNNQIIRVGNNINQIARSVNMGFLTEGQKEHLLRYLDEIIQMEKQLMEEVQKKRS